LYWRGRMVMGIGFLDPQAPIFNIIMFYQYKT
jgi:hypothetical protein